MVDLVGKETKPSQHRPKYREGFVMYIYLQNVKTNVSNAKRNMPKVMKALKSKRFFIRTV